MTNSTKTTKYSAMFLAVILVAGTILTLFPSFMVGTAQAVPYPDMDREKKEDKKSVSVSSLKCNNINVNVNGLTLDIFPPVLGGSDGLAAQAAEDNIEASSFAGNNGGANDGSQINDFRFICINNNNNTVVGAEKPIPPIDPCENCFAQELNATQFAILEDALAAGIEVIIGPIAGEEIVINSFAELCDLIEENRSSIFTILLQVVLEADIDIDEETFFDILECIETALDIDIPPT